MTNEEYADYSKLTLEQQKEYDYQQEKHPYWAHNKLLLRVGFSDRVDNMLENGGDVDVNDRDVMSSIVQGVGQWLERTLPKIWEGVKSLFANLLENIISGVINFFGELLSEIF